MYFSWRTMDSESCWESVGKLFWFWRETTNQTARRCRHCSPVPTWAYEKVKAQGSPPNPPTYCCRCRVQSLQPVTTWPLQMMSLLVHLEHRCSRPASLSDDSGNKQRANHLPLFFFLFLGTAVTFCSFWQHAQARSACNILRCKWVNEGLEFK